MSLQVGLPELRSQPVHDATAIPPRRQAKPARSYAYLLDADDELAEEFDIRTRIVARQATTVKVFNAQVGECDLWPAFDAVGAGAGLLVLDGLIARETCVATRAAAELVGAGDLLQPPVSHPDELLGSQHVWHVLWPTKLALLDEDFSARVRPWPKVMCALWRRLSRRVTNVDEMRAITSHPRLELRLVLLFWHLAGRWGRVEPSGIHLTLPLTHRLLGQLVGAERPSISHALARLAHAGLLSGSAGDIHLHGTVSSHLERLLEHTSVELASGW
jgi:CRP/FNR family cyclic AMP-dependent transcriptional regulator